MNRTAFFKFCEMLESIEGLKSSRNMLVDEQPEPITAGSSNTRWKWFKNFLGALDGTHIKIKVPTVDKLRYRTRKGDIATNMLGVCTPDMQFVYVLPSWEGTVADGRVLRDAISRRHGLKVPHGKGYQPSSLQEFFNMKHASTLRSPSFYLVRVHNRIIIACCLLHNFIRTHMSIDSIAAEVGEGLPSNVVDDDEPNIANIHPSDAWAAWRLELANQMFDEWQASRN
ncbi:hypothetical protein Gotur_026816 [Gossypium turneri]